MTVSFSKLVGLRLGDIIDQIVSEIEQLQKQVKQIDAINKDRVVTVKPKRKRTPVHKKNTKIIKEMPARYYLNDQYRGLSVVAATLLAGSKMGDNPFKASDIGRKIYDYRGVVRFSNMHSVVGNALDGDERFVRVDRGVYMWDDHAKTKGTHATKLKSLCVERFDKE